MTQLKQIDPDIRTISQTQIQALRECLDLSQNGYDCIVYYKTKYWWYCKYRHCSNGRTLVVQWRKDYYTISEGKKILKRYPA